MGEVIEHDIDIMESQDEEVCISGVPSGYATIDRLTFGWQKGELHSPCFRAICWEIGVGS